MIKTEKLVCIKKNSRSRTNVVREHYLRKDIPCKSALCSSCDIVPGVHPLPTDSTHYVLPDCKVASQYLEIFELKELTGIIFLQTVQHYSGRRIYKKVYDIINNPLKQSAVFNNEFQQDCYAQRKKTETIDEWRIRNIYSSCIWYHDHLKQVLPIIIITDDADVISRFGCEVTGIFFLTMGEYLTGFWPELTEAHDLLESLELSEKNVNIGAVICKEFQEYYPQHVLIAGIKSGRFVSNYLKVNKHNSIHEAIVQSGEIKGSHASRGCDILIPGTAYRNRALDGDLVAVEILPEELWQSKSSSIFDNSNDNGSLEKDSNRMMSGRVVGIVQRNLRDYVVALQDNEAMSDRCENILTIPWDRRIPKIRISTRQVNRLKKQRFIVRIDSWETNSLYPKGHFVKALGPMGDIETEIETILTEHNLLVGPFSEGILKEMPVNTESNPWKMNSHEIAKRVDLRSSHLVFSIDPKGCEDVDDTLSVRILPDGTTELGVHIADVTHFVKPNSLTDLEAQKKTTTVYLADRRYDMLPSILSADLCSLISGVDRYAVSVIWTLDTSTYDVIDVWYGRTIICSKYKLYYEAAQRIADGDMLLDEALEHLPELKQMKKGDHKAEFQQLKKSIKQLMHIARQLKQKRAEKGAVDLEASEIQLQIGDSKEVKHLTPKKALEIHDTIAECMIFANHWVAKQIMDSFKTCAILRNHPAPNQDYFSNLKECALSKGFKVDSSSNHALSSSLDQCVDVDASVNKIMRMLATQAMMVASYFSTGSVERENFHHYGLALEAYTHFTSPIRRYADILVHRLLLSSVGDPSSDSTTLLGNKELQNVSDHINVQHQEAVHAQKESVQIFQSLYFKEHDNDDVCLVEGLVYNIRTNGVLIFVPKYGIKGAVFLKDRSGKVYRPCKNKSVELVAGTLHKHVNKIVINHSSGSTDVSLFTYLKVRISVEASNIHTETLKFNLVSFKPSISFDGSQHKVEKHDLIQNVKETESKRYDNTNDDLAKNVKKMNDINEIYGSTPKGVDLYNMFLSFKQTALLEKR